MLFERAERLKKLPPYLFVEIDRAKAEARRKGKDVIDLGVGDPDQPTPEHVIRKLAEAAKDPANHHYAFDRGLAGLRIAVAGWYERRFGVKLDPETEVLPLLGSKEGIAHIPLAFINPGDEVLIPEPCYPPYRSGTIFAGGIPRVMPLLRENGFLPDLDDVDAKTAKKAKLMFVNYPNNPTAAVADEKFFHRVVDFARRHDIIVCHDAAYSEVAYDGYRPPSFLESEGAMEIGVEFHSLSKTRNMTGWRVGFACGNREIISGLSQVKSNIDSGIFQAIQIAAVTALEDSPENRKHQEFMNRLYQERRDVFVGGLNRLGWKIDPPKAAFYVWIPVPAGTDSTGLCRRLLEEAAIVTTPGVGFGAPGEGYIRATLTVAKERLAEAVERIKKIKL